MRQHSIVRIVLFIFSIALLPGISARAQSNAIPDVLEDLKSTAAELMKENENLKQENESLQEEINVLQEYIAEKRTENEKIERETAQQQKLMQLSQGQQKDVIKEQETMAREIRAWEKKNEDMERELMEVSQRKKLWELKRNALKSQLNELELAAQLKERPAPESPEAGNESAVLKDQLDLSEQKLDNTRELALDKKAEQGQLEQEIEGFNDQITRLNMQIAAAQESEQERLKKIIGFDLPEVTAEISKKTAETKRWQQDIDIVKDQIAEIKDSVEISEQLQKRKKSLLGEMLKIDADNQALRKRAAQLQKEGAAANKEEYKPRKLKPLVPSLETMPPAAH